MLRFCPSEDAVHRERSRVPAHSNEAKILAFARREAGDLAVELKVLPEPGDRYAVERRGAGIRVTGSNARSCLHGVYHALGGRAPGVFRAAFTTRGINTCESLARHTPAELRQLIDRMGKWRLNSLVVHVNYGWKRHRELIVEECAKRGIDLVFYVYTSMAFLPPDAPVRWLATWEDGTPYTQRVECETRLCVSDPEGVEAFRRGAREFFKTQTGPAARLVAMTGDGYGHCRCPKCRGLNPVEQWQPLLKCFVDAGSELAPEKELESLVYVQRLRPPADMALHRRLDGVLFDDHLRNRWRPLGDEHPIHVKNREAEVDPAAEGVPVNIYLMDRLREWREKFDQRLCVFHNLQLHGALSCPQPNTAVLLEDLRRWQRLGVDGVVYEALNGMAYFEEQLRILSDGLWDPSIPYTATRLERWCSDRCPPGPLFFLKQFDFPWDSFKDQFDDVLREHMENIREFYASSSPENLRRVVQHMYAHADRIDRLSSSFRFLKMVHAQHPLTGATAEENRFLASTKPWDFMEPLADPISETDAVIQSLVSRLK